MPWEENREVRRQAARRYMGQTLPTEKYFSKVEEMRNKVGSRCEVDVS